MTSGKRTFQQIDKTINLRGATPHVFRPSFLIYAQTFLTNIRTVQAIADIQTPMNRYVHQQSDRIVETGKRVTDLFVKNVKGDDLTGRSGEL